AQPASAPRHTLFIAVSVAAFCGAGVGRLGVCAATLDAGLSRPSSTNPRPRRPGRQRNGAPKANPHGCGIATNGPGVRALARSCEGHGGPGTPGGALRPGPTGVCATSGPRSLACGIEAGADGRVRSSGKALTLL